MDAESREAITFALKTMDEVVRELEAKGEKEKANFNEGIEFALRRYFEFDDEGNCLGINKTTVYEELALKYKHAKT